MSSWWQPKTSEKIELLNRDQVLRYIEMCRETVVHPDITYRVNPSIAFSGGLFLGGLFGWFSLPMAFILAGLAIVVRQYDNDSEGSMEKKSQ